MIKSNNRDLWDTFLSNSPVLLERKSGGSYRTALDYFRSQSGGDASLGGSLSGVYIQSLTHQMFSHWNTSDKIDVYGALQGNGHKVWLCLCAMYMSRRGHPWKGVSQKSDKKDGILREAISPSIPGSAQWVHIKSSSMEGCFVWGNNMTLISPMLLWLLLLLSAQSTSS
jgi:hypothetical protein